LAPDQQVVTSADPSVARVRRRLTLWYAGTFAVILLVLGFGLFTVIGRQLSSQLDASLDDATLELARVAGSRELAQGGDSALVDALDALKIPQRTMYLLDSAGKPISPTVADPWIRAAAVDASRHGVASVRYEDDTDDRTLRLSARRFRTATNRVLVAAAIADQFELEDRYTDLIGAFALAAVAAIVLVAIGGSLLAAKSMAPISATIANMRRFMADAAHELKTPVAILRANSEVALQRSRDTHDYRTALASVETESRRLGRVVEHMLLLAQADAGGRALDKKNAYLDDIVDDCVTSLQGVAERKDVALNVSRFEETPILADVSLVRELVMILLDNAIKFTPAGGSVDVAVSVAWNRPTLAIVDTGIGIAPDHLPRIFDRFYRVRGQEHVRDGSGLGLSIARWIANQHSATIEVRSEPGNGTAVTLAFPPTPTTLVRPAKIEEEFVIEATGSPHSLR
jgi:signal transduction histidine kinase